MQFGKSEVGWDVVMATDKSGLVVGLITVKASNGPTADCNFKRECDRDEILLHPFVSYLMCVVYHSLQMQFNSRTALLLSATEVDFSVCKAGIILQIAEWAFFMCSKDNAIRLSRGQCYWHLP